MSVKELKAKLQKIDKATNEIGQAIKNEISKIPVNKEAGLFETKLLEEKIEKNLTLKR